MHAPTLPPKAPSPLRHPPRLVAADGGHRHATWLELFFDLVFVAAVARLGESLVEHPNTAGFIRFAALFVAVAWAWMGFTYYANRFDTDDVAYRATVSASMLAVAAMGVAIGESGPGWSARFALAYVAVRLLLLLLYARARRHVPPARGAIDAYLAGFGAGALLWLASLAVPPPARYALWALGLAVEFATPLVAWRVVSLAPIDRDHLGERFGLFTIIVLGEAVVAVVTGARLQVWDGPAVGVAAVGFLAAVAMWWIYFDFQSGSIPRRGLWAFVSSYGHVPLWMALAAFGAGTRLAIEDAGGLADLAGERWALAGSATAFLIVIGAFHLASARPEHAAIGLLRLGCAALLTALAAAGDRFPVATLMVLVAVLLVVGMLLEAVSMRDALRGALARAVAPPQRVSTQAEGPSPAAEAPALTR